MKLQKLAGYGPLAAYVSGGSLIVVLFLFAFGPAIFNQSSALLTIVAIILISAATLWLMAMVVVGIDLEWLEHPMTHSGRIQTGLVASVVSVFVPPIFALGSLVGLSGLASVILALLPLCVGFFMVIQNAEARRAGILAGALPVVGIISGMAFLIMFLSYVLALLIPILGVASIFALLVGAPAYVVWSIWLGTRIGAAKQAAAPA